MYRRLVIWLCLLFSLAGNAQPLSSTEQRMEKLGLVDISTIIPDIHISLMYTRPDNFVGKVLYKDLHRAYLLPETAKALQKAQQYLKETHHHLSIIVYDATRPLSVQRTMWNAVKGTHKAKYVSNPANGGGLHNYGLAVDVTLCDEQGDTLHMGTIVDHLGKEAHIDDEVERYKQGKLSKVAFENRKLLRSVMVKAGFKPLKTEWWHFNFKTRAEAKQSYRLIP